MSILGDTHVLSHLFNYTIKKGDEILEQLSFILFYSSL